jgi:PTH1 family peptidyl-tRNA hydrolase
MPLEYVIAGLGNPGDRYRATRHNLGFRVVESLARARSGRWREQGRNRRVARIDIAGHDVLLLEPLTFMNLSGNALRPVVDAESVPPARVLVVCDDIALPLGQLRLRPAGSDGGHNGLVSVIERLETTAFPRLRMGVGPVPPRVDPAEFVLAEFLPEEAAVVDEMIQQATECAAAWIAEGIDRAMGRFNTRREPLAPE